MDNNIKITYHFVSGETLTAKTSEEMLKTIQAKLCKGWKDCYAVDDTFGLNYAHVTHYTIDTDE